MSGIEKHVTQISHVPNSELRDIYNAADVFVFPSQYEGFGIPLIEAMACGTPVVCTDMDLFREICGDAAYFVDTNQPRELAGAIEQVLSDTVCASNLKRNGAQRASQFTWERCARETAVVYSRVFKALE